MTVKAAKLHVLVCNKKHACEQEGQGRGTIKGERKGSERERKGDWRYLYRSWILPASLQMQCIQPLCRGYQSQASGPMDVLLLCSPPCNDRNGMDPFCSCKSMSAGHHCV
ncbi:uncharacterized protein ASPGLDRAFT_1393591 [Aspergillus glaucus CBS 516.65]|uniref:Uncharacterized protein n=1 Tax=Aspergillus glaucus CBS 516.65 TaxID=1160497 RepID=A0A1L9VPJ5_ASPGL|nr:hypothetical protein ASPGLDRAFT_1393591 [Aspergillus glaucus CBS 516.65]OJJ85811.1 hypothetical protein ASPGLDRAFT_1393591 [Aspergillus glaucus CBS 516.65]